MMLLTRPNQLLRTHLDLIDTSQTATATPCVDCGHVFTVPPGEAAFALDRGLPPSTRCPSCRAKRRAERNGDLLRPGASSAPRYALNDHGTFGGVAPVSTGFRSGASTPRFSVVCSSCGKDTTVPFEPRRGRAVYCKACFDQRRG